MARPPTQARGLGTGGISIGFAKLFFLLAGYTVSIYLTQLVSPATYGDYNVLSQAIAIPNMVLIQTLLFAVSRPMSAEHGAGLPSYDGLRRRGFRVAFGFGGLVTAVLLLGADLIATHFLQDPALADPLRILAPIPLLYAVYAVNVGTLNATRRFQLQATLDVVMAASKAGLIIGAAALGLGLTAILGGFSLASALAFALSIVFVLLSRPAGAGKGAGPLPPMASFAVVLAAFTFGVNVLQGFDLFVLKRLAVTQAMDDALGFYSSAQLIARVPYSMMNAVSLVALGRSFHARVPLLFFVKIAAATACVEVAAHLWSPAGKLGILVKLAALALVFALVVVATRAFNLVEVRALRRKPTGDAAPAPSPE